MQAAGRQGMLSGQHIEYMYFIKSDVLKSERVWFRGVVQSLVDKKGGADSCWYEVLFEADQTTEVVRLSTKALGRQWRMAEDEAQSGVGAPPSSWDYLLRGNPLIPSAFLKFQRWVSADPAVLVISEHGFEPDDKHTSFLLQYMIQALVPVQVAYFQGCTSLAKERPFTLLLELLQLGTIWSANLGEISFTVDQTKRLAEALVSSSVGFMFYECNAGALKERFQAILRANRKKASCRYIMGDDEDQNEVCAVQTAACAVLRTPHTVAFPDSRGHCP